jgi:hypothetical protein
MSPRPASSTCSGQLRPAQSPAVLAYAMRTPAGPRRNVLEASFTSAIHPAALGVPLHVACGVDQKRDVVAQWPLAVGPSAVKECEARGDNTIASSQRSKPMPQAHGGRIAVGQPRTTWSRSSRSPHRSIEATGTHPASRTARSRRCCTDAASARAEATGSSPRLEVRCPRASRARVPLNLGEGELAELCVDPIGSARGSREDCRRRTARRCLRGASGRDTGHLGPAMSSTTTPPTSGRDSMF